MRYLIAVCLAVLCCTPAVFADQKSAKVLAALESIRQKEKTIEQLKKQQIVIPNLPKIQVRGKDTAPVAFVPLLGERQRRLSVPELARAKAEHDAEHNLWYGHEHGKSNCNNCSRSPCVCGARVNKRTTTTRTYCPPKPQVPQVVTNNVSYTAPHHNSWTNIDNSRRIDNHSVRIQANSNVRNAFAFRNSSSNSYSNSSNYRPYNSNRQSKSNSSNYRPYTNNSPRSTVNNKVNSKVNAPSMVKQKFVDIYNAPKQRQPKPQPTHSQPHLQRGTPGPFAIGAGSNPTGAGNDFALGRG